MIIPGIHNQTAEFRPILDAGIYQLPSERYHADPCPAPSLSNSIANILLTQSPLHARLAHPRLNPNYELAEDSRFDIGSAAHMMLLERDISKIAVIAATDWRTKVAKESRELARANGMFPVLAHHYNRMVAMVEVAREFIGTTELAGILEEGQPEQTVIWQENGVWCRARPDLLSGDLRICLDYKTCESAEPESFIRQIGRMSYDLQAEFYVRGVRAVTEHEPVFVFLAQEITAPYACSLVALSNAYREIGRAKVQRALEMWRACVEFDQWKAYSTRIHWAEPTSWQVTEMEVGAAGEEESGDE